MKTGINKLLLNSFSRLLIIVIGLAGFTISCRHEDEYGTPMADFILQGTVKSKVDHHALPDIEITLNSGTAQTDLQGYFEIGIQDFPQEHTYDLRFHDTDSLHNGHFGDMDTVFHFYGNNFQGGDGEWYEGKEIENISILLDTVP